jgi:hypothetical protein
MAKKKKKGLIIALALLAFAIIAGIVLGLGYSGKIYIPMISPGKKKPVSKKSNLKKPATTAPQKKTQTAPEEEQAIVQKKEVPKTKFDSKSGASKLAEAWAEVPAEKLVEITNSWKPVELAEVLSEMEADKVAALLALVKPSRASDLSRQLRILGSNVPNPELE